MRKLILCILFSLFYAGIAQANGNVSGMAQVHDADTILINGESIEFFGIDAPEWAQACKFRNGKKFFPGSEARAWLKSLVYNKIVSCNIEEIDRHKRKIATCYLQGKDEDIGALLVLEGYAFIFSNDIYAEQQKEAKSNKKGVWRGKCQQPLGWRRENR